MRIEAEAIIFMKRFKYLRYWKAFSDYLSWMNLDREILELSLPIMPCDGMLIRYVYDKPYQILVPSRNDWSSVPMHPNKKGSVWYTDGSKANKNTGVGVCFPDEHLR